MSTPYAKALVRIAGGATQSGGITVAASQSVALQGENTTGWRVAQWQIIGPPGWAAPAGWTDVDGVATYTGTTENPPSWTLPTAADWGKWAVTLTVNGGEKDGDAAHPEMVDTTLMLSLASANGLVDLAVGEAAQFDELRGWSAPIQTALRAVDDALGLISGAAETVTLVGTGTGPAGAFAIGDVVCSANDATDKTKVKLATAANLTNADESSIKLMLETGVAGEQKLAAGVGDRVAQSVTGIGTASTVDLVVINTTTGRCARANVALRGDWLLGSADKNGNMTVAPQAPAYGPNRRKRRSRYNFLDWSPDETGATNALGLLAQAIADVPNYSEIFVSLPSSYFKLDVDANGGPAKIWDDLANGNKRGIRIVGEGGPSHSGGKYHFRCTGTRKSGTAASITARTNGGPLTFTADNTTDVITYGTTDMPTGTSVTVSSSGTLPTGLSAGVTYYTIRLTSTTSKLATSAANAQAGTAINFTTNGTGTLTLVCGDFHQTITGCTGVLAADVARWRGRFICLYNAATDANNCDAIIVDVPSDGTLRISNQNTGAAATDANNGSLCWWIDEPVLDIRAKCCALENLGIGVIGSAKLGALVEFNHAPGESANAVLHTHVIGCNIETDSRTSGTVRDLCWVARDMLPTHYGNYAWRGLNGLGEYQVGRPSQCDTFRFIRCNFSMATRSCVTFWSVTAQSKENRFKECQFGAGAVLTQHAVCVPKDVKGAGGWSATGNAHFDFYDCGFGLIQDAIVQLGGYGSKGFMLKNCYSENSGMIMRAGTNTSHVPIKIQDCCFSMTPSWRHKSGQIIKTNGAGPLVISGGSYDAGGDGHDMHIEVNHSSTSRRSIIKVRDWWMKGTTSYSRRVAFRVSTIRGPFNFSGLPYLRLTPDGGAAQEVQVSQAGMNSACGYTVNLAEIHTWELAAWINANFTGIWAWGEGDDSFVYVRTSNLTSAGMIQVGTAVGSPDLNTKVGWNTGLDTAGAQTQHQKDSAGIIDVTKAAGTAGWIKMVIDDVTIAAYGTDNDVLVNNVNKHFNLPAGMGRNVLENIAGLSATGGVPPKNFHKQLTHTGSTGTSTFTANAGTEEITFTAGVTSYFTKVQFTTTGTLPAGLSLATDYWLIWVSSTVAKVATSLANAIASTAINITDAGTGTHTLTVQTGGSTVAWVFDTAEEDANYVAFAVKGKQSGSPSAGAKDIVEEAKSTTVYAIFVDDPGSGNTVNWHMELRR